MVPNRYVSQVKLSISHNNAININTRYSNTSYSGTIPEIIYKNMFNERKTNWGSEKLNDSYIIIIDEDSFFNNPKKIIDLAYTKRDDQIKYNRYSICNNLHLK
ncbi:MAG: hypothetical protein TYPL_1920 [Candidatus Tyloplasma litorale]|nr:MAG: hypothetical protein TYPL_1920 [Mycoplasmatales bacterium]